MTFWVFAYGSLMADGWEKAHGCSFRCPASLQGYSRSFDKASTESRGTRDHPAPTLRIVPAQAACHGVAFQFPDERNDDVRQDLLDREGNTFPLREKLIALEDGREVVALVPMYEGKRIIKGKTLREFAEMAIQAKGIRSDGVEYVREIAKHLKSAGIDDPVVTDFLGEIDKALGSIQTR